MPLLKAEPSVYPADLLEGPLCPAAGGDQWWALHTRPRAEKALARRFLQREMAYFLPVREKRWADRGRRFCSRLPLFPGYLFVFGNQQTRLMALETGMVVRCLEVCDQDRLHADLQRVHRLIRSGLPLTAAERLAIGSPVRVTRGPLAGMEGRVARHGKRLRLLVEVQFIQQSVSIELESWMLEALDCLDPVTQRGQITLVS